MTILDRVHVPRPDGLSAMLLVLLIIAPVTLAHASPPDLTWLALAPKLCPAMVAWPATAPAYWAPLRAPPIA